MNVNVNLSTDSVNLNKYSNADAPAGHWNFHKIGKGILVNTAIFSAVTATMAVAIGALATHKNLKLSDWDNWHTFSTNTCRFFDDPSVLDYFNGRALDKAQCLTAVMRTLSFSENMAFSIKMIQDTLSKYSLLIFAGLVAPEVIREATSNKQDNAPVEKTA